MKSTVGGWLKMEKVWESAVGGFDNTRGGRLGKMVKILEPSSVRMSQHKFRGIDVRVGSAAI